MKIFHVCLAVGIAMALSACTSAPKVVYKTSYVVPEIADTMYTSCPKPTTVESDMGGNNSSLSKLTDAEVDVLLTKAYANTKTDHVACYKTVVNLKAAYDELRKTIDKGND